jgi:hypothetical protein
MKLSKPLTTSVKAVVLASKYCFNLREFESCCVRAFKDFVFALDPDITQEIIKPAYTPFNHNNFYLSCMLPCNFQPSATIPLAQIFLAQMPVVANPLPKKL